MTELTERLRYRVNNLSAWPEGFDENGSELFREASAALDAKDERIAELEAALQPFSQVALWDIGADEHDNDLYAACSALHSFHTPQTPALCPLTSSTGFISRRCQATASPWERRAWEARAPRRAVRASDTQPAMNDASDRLTFATDKRRSTSTPCSINASGLLISLHLH